MKCPQPAAPVYKGSLSENFQQIFFTKSLAISKSTSQDPKSHSLRNSEGSHSLMEPQKTETLVKLPPLQGRNTQAGFSRSLAHLECLEGNYYQNEPDSQPLFVWHLIPSGVWTNNSICARGGTPNHPQLSHALLQGLRFLRTTVT